MLLKWCFSLHDVNFCMEDMFEFVPEENSHTEVVQLYFSCTIILCIFKCIPSVQLFVSKPQF